MIHGGGVRYSSTLSLEEKEKQDTKEINGSSSGSTFGGNKGDDKGEMSYWGIAPTRITKPDGTEWKWNCFKVCTMYYVCVSFYLFSMVFYLVHFCKAMGDI